MNREDKHKHESGGSDRDHEHSGRQRHSHDHGPGPKTHFHDPEHAAEFDRRRSPIRDELAEKLAEMLSLNGDERVLEVATGTGRVARPVARRLKGGVLIGIDQALAMLDVGHGHEESISAYLQAAAEAHVLPFKPGCFDRAFVSFSLHHFGDPAAVAQEVLRVLKPGGSFLVLDPVVEETKDSTDVALEARINQVFRRTHGPEFRFHTMSSIQRLLTKAGYRVRRSSMLAYAFDQEGMDGVPTGRHWLEVAEELEKEAPALAERMRKNYFIWHRHDEHVHVKGSFSYALICAVKPA